MRKQVDISKLAESAVHAVVLNRDREFSASVDACVVDLTARGIIRSGAANARFREIAEEEAQARGTAIVNEIVRVVERSQIPYYKVLERDLHLVLQRVLPASFAGILGTVRAKVKSVNLNAQAANARVEGAVNQMSLRMLVAGRAEMDLLATHLRSEDRKARKASRERVRDILIGVVATALIGLIGWGVKTAISEHARTSATPQPRAQASTPQQKPDATHPRTPRP